MAEPRRSTKIQVIGILNLVGGGLGLIGTLFAVIGLAVIYSAGKGGTVSGGPAAPLDSVVMQRYMIANAPGYEGTQIGEVVIGALFDLMLLVSGFGLLWYQNWARITALSWAVLSLIHKVAYTTYTLLVVMPTMNKYLEGAFANVPPAQADPVRIGAMVGGYFGVCFGVVFAAYPIVVLCLLLSKSAQQALDPGVRYDEDNDRPDDFDRRRERFDDRERRRDDDRYR